MGYGLGISSLSVGSYVTNEYTYMYVVLLALTTIAVNVYFLMSGYFHSKFRFSLRFNRVYCGMCFGV